MARDILVRQLGLTDLDAYFNLRLRGLAEHPEAFGRTYDETIAAGKDSFRPRLEGKTAAEGNFILGASLHEDAADAATGRAPLVGTVAMIRESSERGRHKASAVGMYVTSEAAGRGVGRALLETLIARAERIDGLRQVQLVVASTNVAARGLYESLGFVAYGRERESMRVGDTFHDADLMALFLPRHPSTSAGTNERASAGVSSGDRFRTLNASIDGGADDAANHPARARCAR